MGIGVSFRRLDAKRELLCGITAGDLLRVKLLLHHNPKLINGALSLPHTRTSPLHCAASHGQTEVLLLLLELGAAPNALNHRRQTPLMLACKNGQNACAEKLVGWGADTLTFDAPNGRTCLHYAAKGGHLECMRLILAAAQLPAVSQTWGFTRFVNARDENGATPLHLAARACHSSIVHLLLSNGALVCATTTGTGRTGPGYGSTPLHLAARGGSTQCVKELLAWGADRLQRNSQGHIPFVIAMNYRNTTCAALLNPQMAEPVVWPSPWKFMRNLEPEAKLLLEAALAQANDAWERKVSSAHSTENSRTKPNDRSEDDGSGDEEEGTDGDVASELCYICFDHACTIEVQDCGHQMCAGCTLALCCHQKPNPTMAVSPAPACPFCRRIIGQLRSARPASVQQNNETEAGGDEDKGIGRLNSASKPKGLIEGSSTSSSLMGLMGGVGSFRLRSSARSSSRVMDIDMEEESF